MSSRHHRMRDTYEFHSLTGIGVRSRAGEFWQRQAFARALNSENRQSDRCADQARLCDEPRRLTAQ